MNKMCVSCGKNKIVGITRKTVCAVCEATRRSESNDRVAQKLKSECDRLGISRSEYKILKSGITGPWFQHAIESGTKLNAGAQL